MTIAEAAKYLFVSRPYIRRILQRGTLEEVLPKRPGDEPSIDPRSVLAYREKQEAAAREYQNMNIEDTDPRDS